jgi:hypothetical protein
MSAGTSGMDFARKRGYAKTSAGSRVKADPTAFLGFFLLRCAENKATIQIGPSSVWLMYRAQCPYCRICCHTGTQCGTRVPDLIDYTPLAYIVRDADDH